VYNTNVANITKVVLLVKILDQALPPREMLVIGCKVIAPLRPAAVVAAAVLTGLWWHGEAEWSGQGFGDELAVAGADVRAVGVGRGCDGLF